MMRMMMVVMVAIGCLVVGSAAQTWGAPGPRGVSNITTCTYTTTDGYTYNLTALIAPYATTTTTH